MVLTEILPAYSYGNPLRIDKQVELEKIFGEIRCAVSEKNIMGVFSGLEYVEKVGVHSDLGRCDYLVVPEEKLDELEIGRDALAKKTRTTNA